MKKKIDNKPYTYVAYYRGIPVYVGKGTGDRFKHTNSGQSNNELLNEFYFRRLFLNDMPLIVHKVAKYSGDYLALEAEKELISKYLPYCNKCIGREGEDKYEFKSRLSSLCFDKGFTQPEKILSKFDFRFLFTPKGLYCKSVYLHERSPFEYAFNRYHIRLKREFFKEFPEYALHFVDVPETFHSQSVSSSGYGFFFKEFIEVGGNPFSTLGVNSKWIDVAYKVGGFNSYYIGESRKKPKYKLDIERHTYKNFIHDAHVLDYSSEVWNMQRMYHNKWDYERDVSLLYF